jgi:hypothetical protein
MEEMEESDADLRKELEKIYTPLSVAKEEIWRRWNDKALRKKVEDFLGGDIPESLKISPKATLVRHIISPNHEFFHFLDLAKSADLDLALLEYKNDKFVAENTDKYHLCKLFFHNGKGKKNGDKISTFKIINFNGAEGKKFSDLNTIWGENFVDFHHKTLDFFDKSLELEKKIFDISDWLNKHGGSSEKFYTNFLALFICNGILFENYLLNNEEANFTSNVVLHSIKKLQKLFGIKPLIVSVSPIKHDANLNWVCYPGFLKELIIKK